jgi:hypothetical protein
MQLRLGAKLSCNLAADGEPADANVKSKLSLLRSPASSP